ncbi:MAG TPA: class IV adenylate cyclase [Candidatus Acidoferrum sp.]|nr:class IV adenylate cyclase [Candidatus Acidoferrum sp.]
MTKAKPTSREIEIKLPVSDLADLLRRLHQIGAKHQGRVFERNVLYDTPDAGLRRRGRLLRLRIDTPAHGRSRGLMTSKAPPPRSRGDRSRSRYKERLEREVRVGDPIRADVHLRAGGFRPTWRYEKYRTTFRLPGLHLDLDETPVGVFLELEGRPAAIDRVARALGYGPHDFIRGTYWDLYAADCRRQGRELKNMAFPRKKLPRSAVFA